MSYEHRTTSDVTCPVCAAEPAFAFEVKVIRKHRATYLLCPSCGYLFTPRPHWLVEAYASPIARADTGILVRNANLSRQLSQLLPNLFGPTSRYLDRGGGLGILVRMMRDRGFDFCWEDAYCENRVAAGFEANPGDTNFDAVTAFEVLEHLEDPLQFVRESLSRTTTRILIATTQLFAGSPPSSKWWYYAFEMGQHIGFFQRRTLEAIACRSGVSLASARGLHVFSRTGLSDKALGRLLEPPWWSRLRRPTSLRSKTMDDYWHLLNENIDQVE